MVPRVIGLFAAAVTHSGGLLKAVQRDIEQDRAESGKDGALLSIRVPRGIPPGREAALLAVATHCTVRNTLRSWDASAALVVALAHAGERLVRRSPRRLH